MATPPARHLVHTPDHAPRRVIAGVACADPFFSILPKVMPLRSRSDRRVTAFMRGRVPHFLVGSKPTEGVAMKCLWKGSLSLSLGLCVSAAFAEEPVWRAVKPRPAAKVQAVDSPSVSPPLSATVTLDRPAAPSSVPAAPPPPALLDPQLQPVLFVNAANSTPESIARAKGDDVPKPMPVGGPTLTSDVKGTKPPPRLEPEPLGPPSGMVTTTPGAVSTGPIGSSPCDDSVTAGDDCCADGCGGIWLWNR